MVNKYVSKVFPHLAPPTDLVWFILLGQSKERTELDLAGTAVPLEVSAECLTLREGRRGYELVADPVEEELKKEAELIGGAQRRLQQHVDQSFEQLW